MIIVTGAAGFIGSCIVARLNLEGREDLILVDQLEKPGAHAEELVDFDATVLMKRQNLEGKKYVRYIEKGNFLADVEAGRFDHDIDCMIHMGACSSTTVADADYVQRNNLDYTRTLAKWAIKNNVRFIYASSAATYGDGALGYKDDDATTIKCQPLNLYGQSKQDFDLWALENKCFDKIVGLKFFNVFGPNEYHKGAMKSVVAKAYKRVEQEGVMSLFKSYHSQYKDGEQKRDFIYVKDAVDVVLFFVKQKEVNGLFNVGTGQARSWNDVANALFSAVGKPTNIDYIDMPENIRDKYQYFTQADMDKLFACGYQRAFTPLEDAIKDYAKYLHDNKRL